MKIRIGHLSTFYHTAILLMAQGGMENRIGAAIEWKLMGTGPAIMKAFRNNELDLAYIGLPPAIIGIDQGTRVSCVAGGHMEGTVMTGKSEWLGYTETDDLTAMLGQFRGHRIGVPGTGSIHDVILKDCLASLGLSREIGIVNFAWADQVLEAIVNGDVSAAFGTPALAVAVQRYAGGKILYPPSKLWPDNPSYGIVAHRDFLTKQPEALERFLRIHEEAAAFMRERPKDAAQVIAAFVGVVDKEFVMDTLSISPRYCAKLTGAYIASTMKFVPVLKKMGYIGTEPAQESIFFRDIIDHVHPEADHYSDGLIA